jgi:hypothetical protein
MPLLVVQNRRSLAALSLLLGSLLGFAGACEAQSSERTREVVDQAARTAERGVEQAKQSLGDARDDARDGLANAREKYEVDEKVADAKQGLAAGLDEAAQGFAELGEQLGDQGREQVERLGDKFDGVGPSGLEVAPESITCDGPEDARVCQIDPALVAKLTAEPKLLVGEVLLWPQTGKTGQGLQLVGTRTDGITTMLGLREADILLSVNGTKLDSFDAIRALDAALSGKAEAKLVYERDGQREQLSVIQQSP